MTKDEALHRLRNGELTADMLTPLRLPASALLTFNQLPETARAGIAWETAEMLRILDTMPRIGGNAPAEAAYQAIHAFGVHCAAAGRTPKANFHRRPMDRKAWFEGFYGPVGGTKHYAWVITHDLTTNDLRNTAAGTQGPSNNHTDFRDLMLYGRSFALNDQGNVQRYLGKLMGRWTSEVNLAPLEDFGNDRGCARIEIFDDNGGWTKP